jgi:DNA-binding MarR family transcriptional regulator
MALDVFRRLRAIREFEKRQLAFLETVEDLDILVEIGLRQGTSAALTLKQLLLLDISSPATVQRRLRRLRQQGVVQQRRCPQDRRNVELTISARFLRTLDRYGQVLSGAGGPPS